MSYEYKRVEPQAGREAPGREGHKQYMTILPSNCAKSLYDHLPFTLRNNIELARISMNKTCCKFKSIPLKLRDNPEIIAIYMSKQMCECRSFTKIPVRTLRKFDFYKRLCKTKIALNAYSELPKKCQKNRNFVLETVKNKRSIKHMPIKYLDDDEIVGYILEQDPTYYKYISTRLQKLKYENPKSNQ